MCGPEAAARLRESTQSRSSNLGAALRAPARASGRAPARNTAALARARQYDATTMAGGGLVSRALRASGLQRFTERFTDRLTERERRTGAESSPSAGEGHAGAARLRLALQAGMDEDEAALADVVDAAIAVGMEEAEGASAAGTAGVAGAGSGGGGSSCGGGGGATAGGVGRSVSSLLRRGSSRMRAGSSTELGEASESLIDERAAVAEDDALNTSLASGSKHGVHLDLSNALQPPSPDVEPHPPPPKAPPLVYANEMTTAPRLVGAPQEVVVATESSVQAAEGSLSSMEGLSPGVPLDEAAGVVTTRL